MPILENIREYFQSETSRNKNAALAAGILFFAGWWALIDALSTTNEKINAGQIIIGIFGTLSFFMVNTVKNIHLSEDNVSAPRARAAKAWLLIGFAMGFASIVAATWVMVDSFTGKNVGPNSEKWPSIAVLVQNVFILIASLTYKFGRNEEDWSY
uniref:Putative conserved plasma membrane protein n=1 Tax=Tabanus bromius TaxID=304241 RepID=A0A0K8TQM1_TABBR